MRERAGESRLKLWVYYEAGRPVFAVLLSVIVFFVLVTVGLLSPDATALLGSGSTIDTTFQAFVSAIVTGVTLVVTLNQLVLSQEFGTIDQENERFEGTMDVRDSVTEHVDSVVAPSDPSTLLRLLVQSAAEEATALEDALDAGTPDEAVEVVEAYTDSLVSNAETVTNQLEDADFGTFGVLSAALDFNYSLKVFDARRIRARYGEDLPAAAGEHLEELIETLELFAPAREHTKTLYIQWELIDLSRYVLASAIPALIVTVSMLFYYDPGTVGGEFLGVPTSVAIVSAAITTALAPFLVLLSYVLRIASVTKRTLAIGPFTIRDTAD
ncbi:hypothetical protein BRD06_03500 [Halobacteriales archaeon QS_9_67_15]|nr:MAG: hypothetical protein BRD06_03500 [Halobacteriales archaeon QS_9_67_15]